MKSQNERVLEKLEEIGPFWLTQRTAIFWMFPSVTRLAARIHDLKAAGILIEDKWIENYGKARFKGYRLVGGQL